MKILRFIFGNILFFLTLFLLAFIPLYPKLPIVNIQHTWVYIRLEDFVIALTVLLWTALFLFKKVSLRTPLTLPILLFWIVGGIATLHGVLLIFPTISNVFSNVALLSFLRRIEYMFLFFVAFSSMRNMKANKLIQYVVFLLSGTLLLIVGYGFGQKFLGFPAFLTGNEEFAKGIALRISSLGRVPSTFAGQYDLAAYLVLIIPILVSVAFGFKNALIKIFLLVTCILGFVLLFMTVSRVSFFVLLTSLVLLLLFQKKKWVIVSLLVVTVLFLSFSPSLLKRFGNTVSEIDVLVNTKTGVAVGQVKEVPASYFEGKTVIMKSISGQDARLASSSAILPLSRIPTRASLVIEPNAPNGENLPQGTSYVNLQLSPVVKRVGEYFYQKSDQQKAGGQTEVNVYFGEFVIKRAKAYDLSFTTRFQGEWPNTLKAFERNIFFGSGYGSVSLAVDNDYLRILGESGLFGFASFASIFLIAGIYIKKLLSKIDSSVVRSFVLGFVAGTFGLALNAILIDVFEASKVAFTFWLLTGVTLGVLTLYEDGEIDFYREFKRVVTSPFAIIAYIFVATFTLSSGSLSYYFVGDDFTWFRWVVDCQNCSPLKTVINYFLNTQGFFYRPGTKIYFDSMYLMFWLNQTMYHLVSLILHFIVVMLIFLLSKKILRNFALSAAVAFLFLILSGNHEVVFWISSTGFLFNAAFALLSLLFFIYWRENNKKIYFIISVTSLGFSLLFHEVGVIVPLLIILYDTIFAKKVIANTLSKKATYLIVLSPLLPYLILRCIAHSHWFSGDYSYSLIKLPFNFVGNIIGYLTLALFGPSSLAFYQKLRVFSKDHLIFALLGSLILLFLLVKIYRLLLRKLTADEKKIVVFGSLFFIISLLPFLGLGNITSRYSYLSSFGFVLLLAFFFKKIYEYLLTNGKYIATAIMVLIVIVFIAFQLFQLQRIQTDWREAGEKSKNFLVSLDYLYAHYSEEDVARLYFVNVPIRNGEAWVFPVGLSDAVWLVFRNNDIKVYQMQSVDQAFKTMGTSHGLVFKFDDSGSLIEMKKLQNGSIIPIPIMQ